MIPLKITAHIGSTVAFNPAEGLTLDGPMLYHTVLEREGERFFACQDNAEIARASSVPDPDIGLAVHEAGGTWCYRVSLAEIHGHHGTEMHHWNKRFDDTVAVQVIERGGIRKLRKINPGSGEFKAYHQPLYTELVDRLVWYAVGDMARVAELVNRIRALGKKRQAGEGRVLAWTVEEHDEPDRWLWREPGVLARHVPVSMLPDWSGERIYIAYRPPCWLPSNQTLCAAAETAIISPGALCAPEKETTP